MADAVRRGHQPRLPTRVENAPQVQLGLELYWIAYSDLTTCRPPSFAGVPPIPWTAIATYAQINMLDHEQFSDLVYFVRQLDDEFMDWHERQESSQAPIGKK